MRVYSLLSLVAAMTLTTSCERYLDIIPDNVATIENAFAMRDQAEKFLFTCYSYMPRDGDLAQDPAMLGGDEIWRLSSHAGMFDIARGLQNVVGPLGGHHWDALYRGIRDCNIFLENIHSVPDIIEFERRRWIAEVKFLKAYYHFYLVRMYGPIPIIRESLPVEADVKEVKIERDPVDACFAYIVQLLDEAREGLPLVIDNPADELGRITLPIALALKAKVLVTAASPVFNGNADMASLNSPSGSPLFSATFSPEKWQIAMDACKEAIDVCHEAEIELYYYNKGHTQYNLSEQMQLQINIRNSVCERWNSEIIWTNTQTRSDGLQRLVTPLGLDPAQLQNFTPRGELSPPLRIAEQFYTANGVPINEDKEWGYAQRYQLKTSESADGLQVRPGYTTARLHYGREARFYASLGFDGGIWFGQGKYNDSDPLSLFFVEGRFGQRNSALTDRSTVTGYFIKKLVHFQNVIGSGTTYSVNSYSWPVFRLADLYLLYAEAVNEYEGPGEKAYEYIDKVRDRAGLPPVAAAWSTYSTNATKYTTRDGLRDIIHQERLNELAFEGHRFWDLRRWKQAADLLNQPIRGWDLTQGDAGSFYVPKVVFNQTFATREYFWPIREGDIEVNRNLVQNTGW